MQSIFRNITLGTRFAPTLPSQDLPRIHLLHPPDHQRDTWRSNAKFARRLATSTLGIPHELGALGDLGGREGGTSLARWFAFLDVG